MEFIKEINKKYKVGEPIYTSELIKYFNCSRQNVMENIRKSIKKGELRRKMQGVYYIPKIEVIYGIEVDHEPSTEIIIKDKYLGEKDKMFGIYGGVLLENMMHLTEQTPGTITIITNKEKSNKHIIKIDNKEYIMQRPYTKIENKNHKAYMVLEVIRRNRILNSKKRKIIKEFIKTNNISKEEIEGLLKYFPKKTQKDYEISGVNV